MKEFEQHTRDVAQCMTQWSGFFHLFEDAATEAPAEDSPAREPNVSFSMSTPSMPKFSKSFAKTPMARAMNVPMYSASESGSTGLDDTNLSRDLNTLSPPISTPFYKPSKTPGPEVHADDTPEVTPTIGSPPVSTPFLQSARMTRPESEGFNTPGTPPTPIDGDYGPASAAKSQILLFGTPGMLLSSGTRAAAERRLSKKIDAPVLAAEENDPNGMNQSIRDSVAKGKGRKSLGFEVLQGAGTPLSVKLASKLKSCVPVERIGGREHENEELLDALVDNLDKEPPTFDIKLFPSLFQNGEGATQITVCFCLQRVKHAHPNGNSDDTFHSRVAFLGGIQQVHGA